MNECPDSILQLTLKRFLSLTGAFLAATLLAACGGGDGGGEAPGNNACGVLGLNTKIVNGTECVDVNSPVVMVQLRSGSRVFLCTGTMITASQVLTAAHCFFPSITEARIQTNGRFISATRWTVHPQTTATTSAVINDVAVIDLSAPANLPAVPLIASPEVEAGDNIQIFGYGQTEAQDDDTDTLGVLRSGEMEIDLVNTNNIVSVFDGTGSDTCFGDSGGPALAEKNGRTGLVGVTSSGTSANCTIGDVSLFANLQDPTILNFITSVAPGATVIRE